ncbi:MAG: hypothetical protein ACRDTF_12735 [Pseudonocardiaceae bacterium]
MTEQHSAALCSEPRFDRSGEEVGQRDAVLADDESSVGVECIGERGQPGKS